MSVILPNDLDFDKTVLATVLNSTISNTDAETNMFTFSAPANSLTTGIHCHLHASGILSNASAADDVSVRVYCGSTKINEFHAAIGNVLNEPWYIDLSMVINSIGVSGTVSFRGDVIINGFEDLVCKVATINTTTNNNLLITVQWDNAKIGNFFSYYQAVLHKGNLKP